MGVRGVVMNAPLTFSVAVVVASGLAAGASASVQSYPSKPVRIITAAPGNFGDVVSRHLAQQLSERWGRPVIVENRGGAGMRIATAQASKAAPDGYTLLMGDRSALAVWPNLDERLPYDPIKDFSPV